MTLDSLRGKGAFRCGCGARIKISAPDYKSDTCVARVRNERCGRAPITEDPVPVCKIHLKQMQAVNRLVKPEELDDYTNMLAAALWELEHHPFSSKGEHLEHLRSIAVKKAEEDRARSVKLPHGIPLPESVVYYVLFGDRIKIGTTTNLTRRLQDLPHDELLATEPGGTGVERQRHAQFGVYRVTGEWFEMGDELVDHVNELRRKKYRADGWPNRLQKYLNRRV